MALKKKSDKLKKGKRVKEDIIEDKKKIKTRGKKSKSVPESDEETVPTVSGLGDFDDILDAIEKDVGLTTVDNASKINTSTGLLSLDLMLSGGLVTGGWYTFFGGEQSSKSTLAMTQLARAAVQREIPILLYFDFEGSLHGSIDYFLSIAKSQGFKGSMQDMFGIQDPKTGKYIKKPIVRKYQENVAEKFFDLVAKLERSLPDKVYRNEKWWLVYENTKENQSKHKSKADSNLYKKTGKLWVETDNGHPQAMIVVDSYPAMLPERMDEDDAKGGMAAQARMFSEQLKRVKGKMPGKRIVVMGINQLRKAPAVMFGNPEYEPGGESLKFYSDVRIRMASRSVQGGSGQVEEEASVEVSGGKDHYRYIHMRAIKNKLSVPNLEGWARIWVRDANGQARGYDPVYDTFSFLKELKWITGTKNKLKISVPGVDLGKTLTWSQFKMLCLGDKKLIEKALKEAGIKAKPFKLREKLFKIIQSGKATERYFEALASGKDNDEGDDE